MAQIVRADNTEPLGRDVIRWHAMSGEEVNVGGAATLELEEPEY